MWRSQSCDERFTYCAVPEEDGSDKQNTVPQEHPVVHLGVLTRDRRWPLIAVVLFPDHRLLYSLVWEQEYHCREIIYSLREYVQCCFL